jgi:1-acyl-sn-glycerol-3-phosphate acyltransferase
MGLIYQTAYFLTRAVAHCCFDFRVVNRGAIPPSGGLILAMNHQSFLDPPLAGITCDREVHYLARKSLLNNPLLGRLLLNLNVIPYDQEGADMSALKALIRVVRSGEAVVVFPEGTRSRDGQLLQAQSGLGLVVAKTLAPVVPLRIFGAHEAFPRDSATMRLAPVTVVVGDVLRFSAADFEGDSKTAYRMVSEKVMQRIASLRCPPRRSVFD